LDKKTAATTDFFKSIKLSKLQAQDGKMKTVKTKVLFDKLMKGLN